MIVAHRLALRQESQDGCREKNNNQHSHVPSHYPLGSTTTPNTIRGFPCLLS